MKTRLGFVSNSSSSSFVVAFDKTPESVIEMQQLLFDANQTMFSDLWSDDGWPVAEVAQEILRQIERKSALTTDDVVEIVRSGYIPTIYAQVDKQFPCRYQPNQSREEIEEEYAARDKLNDELSYEFATDWLLQDDVRGKTVFEIYLSDDSPLGCAMEHGDLFKRLPHIHVSHH